MSCCIRMSIEGVDKLTRQIWPDTDEGNLYRQLLLAALETHSGYLGRVYPEAHVSETNFESVESLKAFIKEHAVLLSDMMAHAQKYYSKDRGCSASVTLVGGGLGTNAVRYISVVDDPEEWIAQVSKLPNRKGTK